MAIGKFTTAVQAAKAIKSMLPASFYEDMKKYVETQVQSVIEKMNLVSREPALRSTRWCRSHMRLQRTQTVLSTTTW